MKWFLFFIVFNANPQSNENLMFAHKTFATQYECEDFAEHTLIDFKNKSEGSTLRGFTTCVKESEFKD